MKIKNYDAVKTHFNGYDVSNLKGSVSENSAIGYAAYVLDRILLLKVSSILDLGCGGDLLIHKMFILRPDLHIDRQG